MGTIVTLPTRRASRASAPRTDEAIILLFMGVRYVRDFESDESAEPGLSEGRPDAEDEMSPLEIA